MRPYFSAAIAIMLASALGFAAAVHDASAQTAQPSPPSSGKPAAPQAAPKAGAPKDAAGDAALRQRVEQLEEQLIDLQVVIGTLESLAKTPSAQSAGSAPPAAGEAERIQALEIQLKSLSSQIEQLGEKVRGAGEPTKRSEAPVRPQAAPASTANSAGDRDQSASSTESFGSATVSSSRPTDAPPSDAPAYETAPGAALPPIGAGQQDKQQSPADAPNGDVAAVEPPGEPGDSKHDYEVAYSYIIQREYGAAQAGFTDFMKHYPKDPLVPNALYWLGETHYQQRNFADAAEAFDLVTRLYATSPKAPDSQLKRALSFSALGKTNEACAALSVLDKKFQDAPVYVKTRAGTERHRLGCSG